MFFSDKVLCLQHLVETCCSRRKNPGWRGHFFSHSWPFTTATSLLCQQFFSYCWLIPFLLLLVPLHYLCNVHFQKYQHLTSLAGDQMSTKMEANTCQTMLDFSTADLSSDTVFCHLFFHLSVHLQPAGLQSHLLLQLINQHIKRISICKTRSRWVDFWEQLDSRKNK